MHAYALDNDDDTSGSADDDEATRDGDGGENDDSAADSDSGASSSDERGDSDMEEGAAQDDGAACGKKNDGTVARREAARAIRLASTEWYDVGDGFVDDSDLESIAKRRDERRRVTTKETGFFVNTGVLAVERDGEDEDDNLVFDNGPPPPHGAVVHQPKVSRKRKPPAGSVGELIEAFIKDKPLVRKPAASASSASQQSDPNFPWNSDMREALYDAVQSLPGGDARALRNAKTALFDTLIATIAAAGYSTSRQGLGMVCANIAKRRAGSVESASSQGVASGAAAAAAASPSPAPGPDDDEPAPRAGGPAETWQAPEWRPADFERAGGGGDDGSPGT